MIDFTSYSINKFRTYGGGNGNKIAIIYNNETYMLKFPPRQPKKTSNLDYTNACISEYLGCHIYESIGFKTQQTLYGTYSINNNVKEVVACKDFSINGFNLSEFAKIKNSCIGTSDDNSNGFGTELSPVLEAIDTQQLFPSEDLNKHFWNMFIADALLGNFDRHNGNWGLLCNEEMQKTEISPIYDCGSCLYPQLNEEGMKKILSDPAEQEHRIFVFPNSALKIDNKKINYFDFISSNINQDCTDALIRTTKKIDMSKINKIIDSATFLSDIQKEFYFKMLSQRKRRILDFSLEKINTFTRKVSLSQYRTNHLYDIAKNEFGWEKDVFEKRINEIKISNKRANTYSR